VIPPRKLDDFIEDVFGNILDLRECNRRLLEVMYVRQREQAPVIQRIGDVFLDAATEFRLAYPIYIGHLPLAEKRMKEELDTNPDFRIFLEVSIFSCDITSKSHFSLRARKAFLPTISASSGLHSSRSQTFLESAL
jgi:hypothetical protein